MAYGTDLPAEARRHLLAAQKLDVTDRRDVAGYLYGIAAECALKAMMLEAGFRPTANRTDDPFYAHFPELRTMLRDQLQGRLRVPLVTFVKNDAFMRNWSTRMRYCNARDIEIGLISNWADNAKQAVASIGT